MPLSDLLESVPRSWYLFSRRSRVIRYAHVSTRQKKTNQKPISVKSTSRATKNACAIVLYIKWLKSTAASDHTPTSTPILGSEISEMFNAGVGTGGGSDFSSLVTRWECK